MESDGERGGVDVEQSSAYNEGAVRLERYGRKSAAPLIESAPRIRRPSRRRCIPQPGARVAPWYLETPLFFSSIVVRMLSCPVFSNFTVVARSIPGHSCFHLPGT